MADPLSTLIAELARLPGIGPKTATRLAHHLLRVPLEQARRLADAIVEVKEKLFHCSLCNSITAEEPCRICSDPTRDRSRICVVEEPFNIQPLERTSEFHGLYHVLLGSLSPQRGIGPGELRIDGLLARLAGPPAVTEVIVATNPNVEGEATALYLARQAVEHGIVDCALAVGFEQMRPGALGDVFTDMNMTGTLAFR